MKKGILFACVATMALLLSQWSAATDLCWNGTRVGTVVMDVCVTQSSHCSLTIWNYYQERICTQWCCPDGYGSGFVAYGDCGSWVNNGCCYSAHPEEVDAPFDCDFGGPD